MENGVFGLLIAVIRLLVRLHDSIFECRAREGAFRGTGAAAFGVSTIAFFVQLDDSIAANGPFDLAATGAAVAIYEISVIAAFVQAALESSIAASTFDFAARAATVATTVIAVIALLVAVHQAVAAAGLFDRASRRASVTTAGVAVIALLIGIDSTVAATRRGSEVVVLRALGFAVASYAGEGSIRFPPGGRGAQPSGEQSWSILGTQGVHKLIGAGSGEAGCLLALCDGKGAAQTRETRDAWTQALALTNAFAGSFAARVVGTGLSFLGASFVDALLTAIIGVPVFWRTTSAAGPDSAVIRALIVIDLVAVVTFFVLLNDAISARRNTLAGHSACVGASVPVDLIAIIAFFVLLNDAVTAAALVLGIAVLVDLAITIVVALICAYLLRD